MKIGHVREILGKVELGRRAEAEVRKVGKRPQEKNSEAGLAPRHAPQGSSAPQALRTAKPQMPILSNQKIQDCRKLQIGAHSFAVSEYAVFRGNAKIWKPLIGRHSSFTKKIQTGPTPARLLRQSVGTAEISRFP